MSPRLRKAIGLILLLLCLIIYTFAAIEIGVRWLPDHWLAWLIYYPTVGFSWVWPTLPLIRWMQAIDYDNS